MSISTAANAGENTVVLNNKYLAAINCQQGFPVSSIKTVSVVSTSAELADSVVGPVIALGINASLYLINKLNQIACIITDDQNRVYTSKDFVIS